MTEIKTFVDLYHSGFIIIPEHDKEKHPKYSGFTSYTSSSTRPKLNDIRELVETHGERNKGYRLGGIKFTGTGRPSHQIVCIDIENTSENIKAVHIYNKLMKDVPELVGTSYIETTPSGGYHLFVLMPYDDKKLIVNKTIAYEVIDENKKILLAEILGINNGGVTVGLDKNPLYRVRDIDLSDLASEITEETYSAIIESIQSFNQYDFGLSAKSSARISQSDLAKIKANFSISPLDEFNQAASSLDYVITELQDAGYEFVSEKEVSDGVQKFFKHPDSSHDYTLSVHTGHKVAWNYSASDPTFEPRTGYRLSDTLAHIKFDADYLETAFYLNEAFGYGDLSKIPEGLKYYEVTISVDKDNNTKYSAKISRSILSDYLIYSGYRTMAMGDKAEIVRVIDNIVYRNITPSSCRRFIQDQLEREFADGEHTEEYTAVADALITDRHAFRSDAFYKDLPELEYKVGVKRTETRSGYTIVDNKKSDATKSLHFFKDCYIEIPTDGSMTATVRLYKHLDKYVFENQILDINYFGEGEEFSEGDVLNFDIRDFRGFKFLNFMFDIVNNKLSRFKQVASGMGYMLYNFKDVKSAKAVVLMDAQKSSQNMLIGMKAGRTGKSLLMQFLNAVVDGDRTGLYVPIDGVSLSEKNQYSFGNIKPYTQIASVDDLNNRYAMPSLYTSITGNMKVEAKYVQGRELSFAEAPKIIISSNYLIVDNSPSTRNRAYPIFLHNTFSDKYTPYDRYGERFFSQGDPTWTEAKHRKLHRLALYCVASFFRNGFIRSDYDVERSRVGASFHFDEMEEYLTKLISKGISDILEDGKLEGTCLGVCTEDNQISIYKNLHRQVQFKKSVLIDQYRANHPNEARDFGKNLNIFRSMADFMELNGIGFEPVKSGGVFSIRINYVTPEINDLGFDWNEENGVVIVKKRLDNH